MLRYVVLHLAFVVLLVAYLPGALIFRLPVAHPSRRATLAAEERVFWAVAISVGLSSLVAFGLAALGTYQLDRVLGINGLVSAVAAFVCWRARERRAEATAPTRTAVAPLLLVALAAAVFFAAPPAEYVNGGRDPGIYFNTGIQIAKSGSLTIDDRLVRTVPAEYLDLFLRPDVTIENVDRRFLGFFVSDEETGTVVGQFLQLYPVWIAIAYDAYGLTGARYVQGLWALLGVLAVYFAGAALLGRRAAFAGAALLSINVAQVWFARFFNAEMIVQGLVFTGLLAYARAHVDAQRFFAPIAAILFGLTLFAHLLGILVVGAVSMAVILGRCAGQRVQIAFVLPLAVMTAAAAAYFVVVPWPYVLMSFQYILEQEKAPRLVAAAAAAAVAVLVAFRVTDRWTAAAAGARIWLPRLLPASIWLLAAYALVFAEGGDRSPELNPYWLTLYTSFYLQPLGLAAALVGWSVVSGPRFWRGSALVLLSAAFAIVIFYNARITPDHFWMARRYVLIILPVSLLLAGAAAFTPVAWLDRRRVAWAGELSIGRVRVAAGIVLVAALGWQYGHTTWPILRHVEHAGMISALSRLAASLTPRDLLLVESRWLADTHTLAPPLAYVHDRDVLVFREPDPDLSVLREFLDWARQRYARVLFMGGNGTDLLSRDTAARLIASERYRVPYYERALNAFPKGVVPWEFAYGIYDLVPARSDAGVFDLDIGVGDDLYVAGMHGPEHSPNGVTNRWTSDQSVVRVVGTRPDTDTLSLSMSNGGRPARAGPAVAHLFLNERPLGAVPVTTSTFQRYTVTIPPDLARDIATRDAASVLRIDSTPWVPRDVIGSRDARELGVVLARVQLRPAGVFHLDIGAGNDSYVAGMHASERSPNGVTYRWTSDRSVVRVLGTHPDAATLTLHMGNGGRPARAAPAVARLFLDERLLGAVPVTTSTFEPYVVPIPPELARDVAASQVSELRIETPPWVPRDVLDSPDSRELGVMLDRVEIR